MLLLAALLAMGCADVPARRGGRGAPPMEWAEGPFEVLDYQGKAEGAEIPSWAARALSGERQVDSAEAWYFAALGRGGSFRALEEWDAGFSPEQDFPLLAAERVILHVEALVPGGEALLGDTFPALIRAVHDEAYTGLSREGGFWARLRFPGEDETAAPREEWAFIILVTAERGAFMRSINAIFDRIYDDEEPDLSRAQRTAFRRMRDQFWEQF